MQENLIFFIIKNQGHMQRKKDDSSGLVWQSGKLNGGKVGLTTSASFKFLKLRLNSNIPLLGCNCIYLSIYI